MKNKVLYHGSKVPNIKVLEPQAHVVCKGRKVVFATDNRNYALAMIHATGNELAVSYAVNSKTDKIKIYIDELQIGKLKLLENVGYLYEVEKEHFEPSPEKLKGEFVSYDTVTILSEIKIDNIAKELTTAEDVYFVQYDNVLKSMQERGKILKNPEIKHGVDRFE